MKSSSSTTTTTTSSSSSSSSSNSSSNNNNNSNNNVPSFLNIHLSSGSSNNNNSNSNSNNNNNSNSSIGIINNNDRTFETNSVNCLGMTEQVSKQLNEYKAKSLLSESEYSEINNTITFIKSSLSLYKKTNIDPEQIQWNYQDLDLSNQLNQQSPKQITNESIIKDLDYCFVLGMTRIMSLVINLHNLLVEMKNQTRNQSLNIIKTLLKTDSLLKQSVDQLLALFPNHLNESASTTTTNNQNNNNNNNTNEIFNPIRLLPNDAKEMWKNIFDEMSIYIPWSIFFTKLQSYFNVLIPTYEENFRHIIDFTQDGYITPYKLSIFLKWFGPLQFSVVNLIDSINSKIMSGFISGVEASRFLEKKSSGHYIIRFSKTYPGAFAVTFVEQSNNIRHCLLYPVTNGITLLQPPDIFKNLTDFVINFSSKLKYAVGPVEPALFPSKDSSIDLPNQITSLPIPISGGSEGSGSNSPLSSSPSNNNNNSPNTPQKKHHKKKSSKGNDHHHHHNPTPISNEQQQPTTSTATSDNSNNNAANTNVNEKDICIICMDNVINTVFLECGHLSCCSQCSGKLKTCPLCRKTITRVITIFRPN